MAKKIPKHRLSLAPKLEARGFGVMLEHIDSKLDLVVEGHAALDKKIDEHHEEFVDFRGEVNQKFEIVTERFNAVDERFNAVDEKFNAVFDELHLIRSDLKEKVSREEFIVLEKRVLMLERKPTEKKH